MLNVVSGGLDMMGCLGLLVEAVRRGVNICSGGRTGIPRAAFYQLLAEEKVPLPEKLNKDILKELKKLGAKKC